LRVLLRLAAPFMPVHGRTAFRALAWSDTGRPWYGCDTAW
jgi:hypothetical protein